MMMAKSEKNNKMIPKKIHYCWFGGAPLPKSAKNYIASWKKYCPDYEIIQWDESNIDIGKSNFMKEAYENKKWAFVSDYARYKTIYENGGIYLDVDVEAVKSFDSLLKNKVFMGFEGREYVNSGLGFGAVKGSAALKSIIDIYDGISFNAHKDNLNEITTPVLVTNFLKSNGLIQNGELQKVASVTILPEDYLCPKNPLTRLVNITDNTFSIHHYDASWVDDEEKLFIEKLEEKGKELFKKYPDLVSIIIPVYNGENFMREAINSALGQTYKNIEVIVVDDGSSDNTENIALSYGTLIRYIKKQNGGVASALNRGIKSMRGKYFSWLSHDDVYHSEKIEKLVERAKLEDLDTIVISDWDVIDSSGNLVRHCKLDNRLESSPSSFLAFDRKTWLNACAMLIPKVLFDKVGLFDEKLRTTQDYDMHNRLIGCGAKYKIVHKTLFYSRQHSSQGCLIEKNVLQNSDLIHRAIISGLKSEDIIGYFGKNLSEISTVFNSFLSNGYKETPAHIMNTVAEVLINNQCENDLNKIIRNNLVGQDIKDSEELTNEIINKISKKTKKRLLFCSGFWLTGGMERVLANLFRDIQDDYDIYLVTPHDGREGCIELPKKVTHIKVSSSLYYSHFDTVVLSYAMMLDVDVVTGFLNLSDKQLDLYDLCISNGIKTIASNHEYFFYPYMSDDSNIRQLIDKRRNVFSRLDAVLWLTNFSTNVHNIQSKNGYLMPNPNTFDIQKDTQSIKKDKIVLCVGRFNDYVKRVDRIISSFGMILKNFPNSKLMMIGTVDRNMKMARFGNRSVNDMMKEHNVGDGSVIFIGETADIGKYYPMASLIMMTSANEGFPMVLTEALCNGLPVVCNRIPGLEDIVVDGYNGFLTPQDDIKALSDRVCEILADDSLRLEMGENAKKHVSKFESTVISKRWIALIDTIISKKSKEEKNQILNKILPCEAIDHLSLESDLFNEINDIARQSVIKNESIIVENCDNNLGRKARLVRLVKKAIKEQKNNGVRSVAKKTVRKINNKVKNKVKTLVSLN